MLHNWLTKACFSYKLEYRAVILVNVNELVDKHALKYRYNVNNFTGGLRLTKDVKHRLYLYVYMPFMLTHGAKEQHCGLVLFPVSFESNVMHFENEPVPRTSKAISL